MIFATSSNMKPDQIMRRRKLLIAVPRSLAGGLYESKGLND
jgi:hypothetical protein